MRCRSPRQQRDQTLLDIVLSAHKPYEKFAGSFRRLPSWRVRMRRPMSRPPESSRPAARGRDPRPLAGPKHIESLQLPIRSWSAPTYRICKVHRDPVHFGKSARYRFDAPRAEYGVMYVAATPEGAFVETCIRERPDGNLFSLSYFGERKLTEISFSSSLRLVDLTGPGLSLLGVDNRLTSGSYRMAQRWSRAFWSHPDRPDGILYCSRFNPALHSIALFDRAGTGLSTKDCGALADPMNLRFLGEMLDRYRLALNL